MANILDDEKSRNPIDLRLQWKGSNGEWVYWDKQAEQEIPFGNNFKFIILHEAISVGGFSEKYNKGIYSNEVCSLDDVLSVRCGKELLIEGTYKEIKDKIKSLGGKYAKVAYSAIKDKDKTIFAKIIFTGSSLNCYIEGELKPSKTIFVMAKDETMLKKGKNFYYQPMVSELKMTEQQRANFETSTLPELLAKAKEIKEFFDAQKKSYTKISNEEITATGDTKVIYEKKSIEPTDLIESVNDDDLPF